MIFYGINGKHFATLDLPHETCPACRQPGQLQAALISQYAHVYWIPFFPYQKRALVQCSECGTRWEPGQEPAALKPAVQALKKQTSHPYWTWAGLAVLAVFLSGAYLLGIRDHHTDDALLEHPQAGDVYTVHSDSANMYSLLKVRRVSGNGVELVANNFQTSETTPISSLNQDSSYSREPFVLTRLDLQIMRRKGELTDVDRP